MLSKKTENGKVTKCTKSFSVVMVVAMVLSGFLGIISTDIGSRNVEALGGGGEEPAEKKGGWVYSSTEDSDYVYHQIGRTIKGIGITLNFSHSKTDFWDWQLKTVKVGLKVFVFNIPLGGEEPTEVSIGWNRIFALSIQSFQEPLTIDKPALTVYIITLSVGIFGDFDSTGCKRMQYFL